MTDRRVSGSMMQAGSPAYHKIMAAVEKQGDDIGQRMEQFFDRMDGRMSRIETDIAALDTRHSEAGKRLHRELDEVKRDLGETREAMLINDGKRTAAAARGAAAGATEAAASVAERVAVVAAKKQWWEKWQAWATAFVAIVIFYRTIGPIARDVEKLWEFIKGPDPVSAPQNPAEGKS